MAQYRYTALSRSGERLAGEMEAESAKAVLERLRDLGHFPVEATEASSAAAATSGQRPAAPRPGFFQRIPEADITLMTRELGMLLKAGLQLPRALAIIESEAERPALRTVVGRIREALQAGKSPSEALIASGHPFPPEIVNMVEVGEASGTLPETLLRVAEARERDARIRAKAVSAMIYPGLLLTIAFAAVTLILLVMVPKFKQMVAGPQMANLPPPARFVFALSDGLQAYWIHLLIGLAGAILAFGWLLRRPAVRAAIDRMLLRLPLAGNLVRMNVTVRFCRTLGTLLENGVGLPAALSLTRNVLGNAEAAAVVTRMGEALRQGRDMIEPLRASTIFPPIVRDMLRVGEETGRIAPSLLYLADLFEEKFETAIQRLFTILEPLIIVMISLVIAGIVVSVFSAVLSVNQIAF